MILALHFDNFYALEHRNNRSLYVPKEGYGDYSRFNNDQLRDLFFIGTTQYRKISVGQFYFIGATGPRSLTNFNLIQKSLQKLFLNQ